MNSEIYRTAGCFDFPAVSVLTRTAGAAGGQGAGAEQNVEKASVDNAERRNR